MLILKIYGITILLSCLFYKGAASNIKRSCIKQGYKEAKHKNTLGDIIQVIILYTVPLANILYPVICLFSERVQEEAIADMIEKGKLVKIEDN